MEQATNPTRTILFADDDETTRHTMRELLEDEGYLVVTAADGLRAVELFEATLPSVVVTDFEMPGLRGDEVTRQILTHSPDTPVIVVSGLRSHETERLAQLAGAAAFVPKPLDVERLFSLLADLESPV